MLLVRDIMYCKPGQLRTMAEKYKAMSKLGVRSGMPQMRILTDVCGS